MATFYSDFYRRDLVGVPKAQKAGPVFGASYTLSANPTANDTLYMLQIPAGYKVVDGWLLAPDLDTNGTPTIEMDIGISGDATKFLNSGVLNGTAVTNYTIQGGSKVPFLSSSVPYTPTSATDIIITFTGVAATFAAGTVSLYVVGEYLGPT